MSEGCVAEELVWLRGRARAASGTAILYATHRIEQAEKLCDRCEIMHRGRNVAGGTVAELKARAGGPATVEEVFFAVTSTSFKSRRSNRPG